MPRSSLAAALVLASSLACASEPSTSPMQAPPTPSIPPRVEQTEPVDPLSLAREALEAHAWADALEHLRKAEALHPADVVAAWRERVVQARWLARGDELDFEWLELQIHQRVVVDPRDATSWAALARLHLERSHRDVRASEMLEVELILDQAEQSAGESAELELVRGLHAQLVGRHDLAIAAWSRALELDPELDEARLRLGIGRLEQRDFVGARELLLGYVERFPSDPEGWLGLGVAHARSGEIEQAVAAYARVIELDPADLRPRWNLAWTHWVYIAADAEQPAIEDQFRTAREEALRLLEAAEQHPLAACERVAFPDPECLAAPRARQARIADANWLIVKIDESLAPRVCFSKLDELEPKPESEWTQAEKDRRRKLLELEAAYEAAQAAEAPPEPVDP